jgi:hypothetical protein
VPVKAAYRLAPSRPPRPPDEVWYHGYQVSWTRNRGIGEPTMNRPTRPKDSGQEAHNQGSLEIIIR